MLRGFVRHLRDKCGYRVLPYLDDFLIAPSRPGRAATLKDVADARDVLDRIMRRLGIVRHKEKGCWTGSQRLDHLGMHLDTVDMRVYVADRKVAHVRRLAKKMLLLSQLNRMRVSLALLRHFCGVCVSLTLALPLARFYTRSLFFDMAGVECEARRKESSGSAAGRSFEAQALPRELFRRTTARESSVRLSHQSIRDLRFWRSLARGEGRDLQPSSPDLCMHSDAAEVGYGGTLGTNTAPGSPGLWVAQGFWSAADRAKSMTLRELRAVRLLLARSFAAYVSDRRIRRLLLHEDNQAVVCILNSIVSASPPMMAELRKLQKMLHALNVRLDARRIPSAVNRYADALSRTWDPGDVQVSQRLLASIQEHYHLDSPAFYHRPMNETRPARLKQIRDQLQTYWGDGKARLWNPPFDFLQITVRKIETESARGVLIAPFWTAQACFARLRGLASAMHLLDGSPDHLTGNRSNPDWRLVVAEIGLEGNGLAGFAPLC